MVWRRSRTPVEILKVTNEYKVCKTVEVHRAQVKFRAKIVTVFKSMRFRRLHERWKRIVLKTLHFCQRFQIDPVSVMVSTGVVWTEGVTASKAMRLEMKPRSSKRCLNPYRLNNCANKKRSTHLNLMALELLSLNIHSSRAPFLTSHLTWKQRKTVRINHPLFKHYKLRLWSPALSTLTENN